MAGRRNRGIPHHGQDAKIAHAEIEFWDAGTLCDKAIM
jgi:hypothetical protein